MLRYDTIEEFNVDSKAEYSALSSTRYLPYNDSGKTKHLSLLHLSFSNISFTSACCYSSLSAFSITHTTTAQQSHQYHALVDLCMLSTYNTVEANCLR